jgi:hypothetical protein
MKHASSQHKSLIFMIFHFAFPFFQSLSSQAHLAKLEIFFLHKRQRFVEEYLMTHLENSFKESRERFFCVVWIKDFQIKMKLNFALGGLREEVLAEAGDWFEGEQTFFRQQILDGKM